MHFLCLNLTRHVKHYTVCLIPEHLLVGYKNEELCNRVYCRDFAARSSQGTGMKKCILVIQYNFLGISYFTRSPRTVHTDQIKSRQSKVIFDCCRIAYGSITNKTCVTDLTCVSLHEIVEFCEI